MDEPIRNDRRDVYLVVGAVLTIIAGVLSLINGVNGLLERTEIFSILPSSAEGLAAVCGILLLVFGAIAVSGGVYALKRRPHLTPVLIGAGLGMLGGGEIGFFLGLVAIVLFWKAEVDL